LDRDGQQRAVAAPAPRRPIGGGEQGVDLGAFEKLDGPAFVAFAGHGQNALAMQGVGGFAQGDVAEERVDGGQAGIAGARAIVAALFEVFEEGADHGGVQVLDPQRRRRCPQALRGEVQ
jgi:hypothetical protein